MRPKPDESFGIVPNSCHAMPPDSSHRVCPTLRWMHILAAIRPEWGATNAQTVDSACEYGASGCRRNGADRHTSRRAQPHSGRIHGCARCSSLPHRHALHDRYRARSCRGCAGRHRCGEGSATPTAAASTAAAVVVGRLRRGFFPAASIRHPSRSGFLYQADRDARLGAVTAS
jgi:hypothetical protein